MTSPYLFAFCSSCSVLASSCRFFSSHTAPRQALHTPSILLQSQRAVALSIRSLWSNTTEYQADRCLCTHLHAHKQSRCCNDIEPAHTHMCRAGADLEILDVNHGGDFLLSLYLLSVWLLWFGAAQKGWLEVFGVCLTLHSFSFPEGRDTGISPAGRHHYCLTA